MLTDIHKFEPEFDFSGDELGILLHKCQAEICVNGVIYKGNGEVRLDFFPQANIHLCGCFSCDSLKNIAVASIDLEKISSFSINDSQVEGFCISSRYDSTTQQLHIKWCPNSEPIMLLCGESTQVSRVIFHLFNFVDMVGTRSSTEEDGTSKYRIEHVDLDYEKWKIELKSMMSTRENIKDLKQKGGYRLTHIGKIQRTDRASFTVKEAYGCLQSLRLFLSFAKGTWCEPICAVGFDASEKRVWELLSSPKNSWQNHLSWFDPHNPSQISSLFPGFMKKWDNKEWRETLSEVIYWYLNANFSSRGIDAGIILGQAAIERLSYELLVQEKKSHTPKDIKYEKKASDRFRFLFSSLKIPLEIPPETPKLQHLSTLEGWEDAPHAITEIRNSLIHPKDKSMGDMKAALDEAWNLSLWYLEMSILAICGYYGTYSNRLKQPRIGQTEDVPWKR